MGFLTPKVPETPKAPNPASNPVTIKSLAATSPASQYASLIGNVNPGLARKSRTNKVSLIGGG